MSTTTGGGAIDTEIVFTLVPAAALIVPVVVVGTGTALYANVALVAPAATVTVSGTLIMSEVVDSTIFAPELGAGAVSVTVAVPPPGTAATVSELSWTPGL